MRTPENGSDGSTKFEALKFNLAQLQTFDPALLLTGDAALDGFVLSLALAYNDLKSIHWMNYVLECHKPRSVDAITAVSGQWNGIRVQAARWLMALASEILHAVASAVEKGVLKKEPIRKTVRSMSAADARRWKQLVRVSTSPSKAKGPLRAYLRDLRNYGVFHFSYTDRLVNAYREFFEKDSKIQQNALAYLSIGPSLNHTRFYFADAAAQRMYCGQEDRQILFDEAADLVTELHHTLARFVLAYLKKG
jgi:hypothetical protein